MSHNPHDDNQDDALDGGPKPARRRVRLVRKTSKTKTRRKRRKTGKKVRLVRRPLSESPASHAQTGQGEPKSRASVEESEQEVIFEGFEEAFEEPDVEELASGWSAAGPNQALSSVAASVWPQLLSKAVESGTEALTDEVLQRVIAETPLPQEVKGLVMGQGGGVGGELARTLTGEVRRFLEKNMGRELQKLLTSVTFEIRTEVRFKPTEPEDGAESEGGAGLRPAIRNRVRIKRQKDEKP